MTNQEDVTPHQQFEQELRATLDWHFFSLDASKEENFESINSAGKRILAAHNQELRRVLEGLKTDANDIAHERGLIPGMQKSAEDYVKAIDAALERLQ